MRPSDQTPPKHDCRPSRRKAWKRLLLRRGLSLALACQLQVLTGCSLLDHHRLASSAVDPSQDSALVESLSDRPQPAQAAARRSQPPAAEAKPELARQANTPDAAAEAVVQVSYHEPVDSPSPAAVVVAGEATQASWGEPCPASTVGHSCGTPGCGCQTGAPPARPNAQEYIFDGGDQQPTVIINKDWSAAGVNPTDTVIYYETLGGQVCVQPSNRVPIYAPRFGAVRQVTGVVLAARAVGTERMLAPQAASGFQENNGANNVMQPLAAHGEQQVGLIDAFQENNAGVPIAQVIPPGRMSEALIPFENIDFFETGVMLDHEIPVLGRVLANARSWHTPESLEVVVDGQAAALVIDAARAQDVHVYELPDRCAMRICKAASSTIADSGDLVRFTIRFDNVGPKPLGNAVIVDSLSPRLEYIEGSQQCSVDVQFSSRANDAGSQELRWVLESPVEPSKGGVISFDCRVR